MRVLLSQKPITLGRTTMATRPGHSDLDGWSWRLQVMFCSDQLSQRGTSVATWFTAQESIFFSLLFGMPVKTWRLPASFPKSPSPSFGLSAAVTATTVPSLSFSISFQL